MRGIKTGAHLFDGPQAAQKQAGAHQQHHQGRGPKQPERAAQISGNEARAPRVQVQNNSTKPVKYFELGWLVTDPAGQQYLAASLPATDPGLMLRPSRTAQVMQDTTLRFTRNGQPVKVQGMTGFVSQVEFENGEIWIPSRQNLESDGLLRLLAPSPEEQRLSDLYRRNGINALLEDLKKY